MEERFKLLLLSGLILFTFYYAYDLPAALNTTILKGEGIKSSKVIYMYVAYSFPNIIAPILIGNYVTFKTSRTAFYLTTLSCVGQLVFTLGVSLGTFYIMLIGRFIYGIGGECFLVMQNKRITGYFRGKELAISLAVLISMGRFGTICNFIISPIIAAHFNGTVACFIGLLLIFLGLIICYSIDNSNDQKIFDVLENRNVDLLELETNVGTMEMYEKRMIIEEMKINENANFNYNSLDDKLYSSPWLMEYENTIKFEDEKVLTNNTMKFNNAVYVDMHANESSIQKNEKEKTQIFYLFLITIFVFASIWAPFYNLAPMIISSTYEIKNQTSGKMMAVLEGVAMLISLVTSSFSDYIGFKPILILLGSFLLIFAHLIIHYSIKPVIICIIILGFASPLISCYWPCIPLVIPPNQIASGFARVTCVINFASTLTPLFVSFLVGSDGLFYNAELFFISMSIVASLLTISIIAMNYRFSAGLNKPEIEEDVR